MQLHTFTHWESEHWSGGRYASADSVLSLDMSFAEWSSMQGGGFADSLPIEYSPCRGGFRPYLAANGTIYGVKPSPDEMFTLGQIARATE